MRRRKFIKDSWKWTGLLFVPRLVRAQNIFPPAFWAPAKVAGGATCATAQSAANDFWTGTNTGSFNWANGVGNIYIATYFVAGSAYEPCKIEAYLAKAASPTFTVKAGIWSHSTNKPGSLLGAWSSTVNSSGFSTSEALVTFTGITGVGTLTNAATYWRVFLVSADGDASNFVKAFIVAGTFPGYNQTQRSADGTTWTNAGNSSIKSQNYSA